QSWLGYTRFASAGWRRFLRIATYLAGLAVAVSITRVGFFLVPGANWDAARNVHSLETLNRMISGTAVLASVLLFLACLGELRSLMRRTGGNHRPVPMPS